MADEAVRVSQQQTKPIKIKKWKIRQGTTVPVGRIILIYELDGEEKPEQKKLKCTQAGIIHKILAKEGNVVQPGAPLYEIKACSHPTIMNDMCAECGADLRKDDSPKSTASVPMIHAIPELKVSEEQAQKIGKADSDRLIKNRKLVLLVDLDQTLIHTTNDNIPPNIKDVYHFQLYGHKSPWYHTRLRPGTHKFLESICEFYELHICTFGARNYAHMIAMFLDPEQKFFSNRILSRDECFNPTSKKANLRALFPCGDDMVCIIDDREDVWSHAANLIHVKPYHFFQHTGDINAPPGLDKHENDDKEGIDLMKIVRQHSKEENINQKGVEEECMKEVEESKEAGVGNEETSESKEEIDDSSISTEKNEPEESNKPTTEEKDTPPVTEREVESTNNAEENEEPALEVTQREEPKIVAMENGVNREDKREKISSSEGNKNEGEDIVEDTEETNNVDTNKKEEESSISKNDVKEVGNISNTAVPANEKNGKLKTVNLPAAEQIDNNLIEIEDPDDYLIYLEDVLKRIHLAFYEQYDKMESGKIPDLKKIIPSVRDKVLNGYRLVFSGLVPTRYKLEQSKAYKVARSLGAEVQVDFDDDTTHLVAVRPGTVKVKAGRRKKNLKIVTSDWLWCCAERWEHVDERIFPLNARGSKKRHPPPHCSSPEHIPSYPEHDTPALRKRTPSGRFMDTINPLMSFSSDDIADMDKEVEDILDDESDDSDAEQVLSAQAVNEGEDGDDTDIEEVQFKHMIQTEILNTYDKTQDDGEQDLVKESESEEEERDEVIEIEQSPKRKRSQKEDEEEELPSLKFRRGECVDNELDVESDDPDSNDSNSFGAPDESDDGEWNMMGAALEREFLSD